MGAHHVLEVLCAYLREEVGLLIDDYQHCEERRWRGPGCASLQVLIAISRYPGEEVPLSAEGLGLGRRHVPFLLKLQAALGPKPVKENAVLYAYDMTRRMMALQALMAIMRMARL